MSVCVCVCVPHSEIHTADSVSFFTNTGGTELYATAVRNRDLCHCTCCINTDDWCRVSQFDDCEFFVYFLLVFVFWV